MKGFVWPEGGIAKFGWQKFIKYRVDMRFFRSSTTVMINLDKYNALSKEGKAQIDAAGIFYELTSGRILREKANANNKKVFASGVKHLKLSPQHAKALGKTIYGSSWDNMKRFKFSVNKKQLRAKLFDDK